MMQHSTSFAGMEGIEYFSFEEDFVAKNIRCIPMIVRLKMDTAGIKLKLSVWNHFSQEERITLAIKPCEKEDDVKIYHDYLVALIKRYNHHGVIPLLINRTFEWNELNIIPFLLGEKAKEFNWEIYPEQWRSLTTLQRFALLKLCRPGHGNKNFPKAMREFKLINENNIN